MGLQTDQVLTVGLVFGVIGVGPRMALFDELLADAAPQAVDVADIAAIRVQIGDHHFDIFVQQHFLQSLFGFAAVALAQFGGINIGQAHADLLAAEKAFAAGYCVTIADFNHFAAVGFALFKRLAQDVPQHMHTLQGAVRHHHQ